MEYPLTISGLQTTPRLLAKQHKIVTSSEESGPYYFIKKINFMTMTKSVTGR